MGKSLEVNVNGMNFMNPFVIASGPPGTNKSTIQKAFNEGWGGVIAKTVSLDHSKVHNVAPRYGKLYDKQSGNVIGFQNIELISDRPIEDWLNDFVEIKRNYPDHRLIASIMEEHDKERWQKLVKLCDETGIDGYEINFSCPHGLPERKMGAAMGQNPAIVGEVTSWVREMTKKPVWSKMTPNLQDITIPAHKAILGGADGISLINTILAVIGIDLKTLRPMPSVKGYSTPGGYSSAAIKPIALRHMVELGKFLKAHNFQDKTSISGMGGIETGFDAAEFILLGAHTVQLCTAPMLQGFKMVKNLITELENFMEQHGFTGLDEFRGHSLQYFTSHAHLVELKNGQFEKKELSKDTDWRGEDISSQTQNMV
jgi:dihydropyrimidine dehydrogenase (NADP+)